MSRRVAITGIGVITPIGTGRRAFWEAVLHGKSGVKHIERFDVSQFPVRIAGEVGDFEPRSFFDDSKIHRMDRFSQFALAATCQAIEDSALNLSDIDKGRIGIILGTSVGGIFSHEKASQDLFTRGYRYVDPLSIPMVMYNSAASNIAMHFGFTGPNFTVTTACASSSNAIGEAYRLVKHGYADVVITGGADATLSPVFFSAWCKLRALSTQNDSPQTACKPFSLNRDGLVLGEGAGILILEDMEKAEKRGADIYGELCGYGNNNDAYHLTFPSMDGEVKAINMALEDAKMAAKDIDYINAHGTATKINDKVETATIKKVFGERAYKIPVSSTKSMIGHTLGASGAIELITCLIAIKHQIVPPTINYDVPDPECDLDYVPNKARKAAVNTAMSNSFAFGGTNVALLVKRYGGNQPVE